MPLPDATAIENALHNFVRIYLKSQSKTDEKALSDLSLDPIPVLLHCSLTGLETKQDLLKAEKWRRLDKAFSNAIGKFHEEVLCSVSGWYKPKTGFDLRNDQEKIIVEMKNKHNTMNSSSAKDTHEKCARFIQSNPDWQVYLATIVPKKGRVSKPWVIAGRTPHPRISLIDGATLYAMVCGVDDALKQVYSLLPEMMARKNYPLSEEGHDWFQNLYENLYSTD